MVLDKQETGTGSSTQWHSCPLCGKVRLTSQPTTQSAMNVDGQGHSASHFGNTQDVASGNTIVSRKGTPYFA